MNAATLITKWIRKPDLGLPTKWLSFLPQRFFVAILLVANFCFATFAQAPTRDTETEVWPEVDAHIELPSQIRILAFVGLEQGVDYPFQQWYAAAGLGYQLKPILRPHIKNIDPDKEHYLVLGAGYEYLQTIQSGVLKTEKRLTIDATPNYRFPAEFLVRDRNWIELRWIDGRYSTTYRNMLSVERTFVLHGFRFIPNGSAEAFYDGAKHFWNEEWYTAGVQWPYKHLLMLDTYYRRENCGTCNPTNWNVGGVTLNFYFGNLK